MRLIIRSLFPSCLLLLLLLLVPATQAADQSLLQLPAAVKITIEREASGHSIAAIERELREGRTVYRVRVAQEGIDKRMVIASDGAVLEVSDFSAVNQALSEGKQAGKEAWEKTKEVSGEAWDATKDVATRTWEATKETVGKARTAFRSDTLTLNQVPQIPRATLEREAAGNRLSDIRASITEPITQYHATVTHPDGTTRALVVRDDGTVVTTP